MVFRWASLSWLMYGRMLSTISVAGCPSMDVISHPRRLSGIPSYELKRSFPSRYCTMLYGGKTIMPSGIRGADGGNPTCVWPSKCWFHRAMMRQKSSCVIGWSSCASVCCFNSLYCSQPSDHVGLGWTRSYCSII